MGVKNPKVAIVNIGAEEKGNALVKETFPMLKEIPDIISLEALKLEIFHMATQMS